MSRIFAGIASASASTALLAIWAVGFFFFFRLLFFFFFLITATAAAAAVVKPVFVVVVVFVVVFVAIVVLFIVVVVIILKVLDVFTGGIRRGAVKAELVVIVVIRFAFAQAFGEVGRATLIVIKGCDRDWILLVIAVGGTRKCVRSLCAHPFLCLSLACRRQCRNEKYSKCYG